MDSLILIRTSTTTVTTRVIADAGSPYSGYNLRAIWFNGSAIGGVPPYNFSWDLDDDGVFDDAYGNNVSKSWESIGVYTISLQVRDTQIDYDINTIQVTVDDAPPNTPRVPDGTATCKINKEYTYTTSTTDQNGDQVYYLWDWGDGNNSGWLRPYNSGVTCEAKHIWLVKDNYSIKVIAKDIYGKESSWSAPLPIRMPYSYKPILQFWGWFFERFPHVFPI